MSGFSPQQLLVREILERKGPELAQQSKGKPPNLAIRPETVN